MSSVHDAHRWPRPVGRTRLAITLLVSALLSACSERAALTTAEQWQLTESLRLGSEDEGPTLFSWVKGLEVDAQGGIRVYEHSAQEIRLFDSTGAFVKVVARRGSGPGELRNAKGIQITRDGRMWLRDMANGRLTVFDTTGGFEATWPINTCNSQGMWDPKEDDTGRLLDTDCVVKAGRADGRHVLGYRRDLSRVDTLYNEPTCGDPKIFEAATWATKSGTGTTYRRIPFAPTAMSQLDGNGMIWCVPNSSQYEVLRLSPGATDTLRLHRDLPPIPVSDADRAAEIESIESRGPTGVDFTRIPTTKPLIARIIVDDTRRVWVQRATADGATRFDVYSPDGTLVAEVDGGMAKFSIWAPFTVRGDDVYTVITDENDIPSVVRYRIDPLP